MNRFEQYLVDNGMELKCAHSYGNITNQFLNWCKALQLNVKTLKRSKFTEWLQACRANGNKEITVQRKEDVVKQYYYFLGIKNNPAQAWLPRRKEHRLPSKALTREELITMYQSMIPRTPVGYRNRCLIGLVIFQAISRQCLWELRLCDIDFEKGQVYIQAQRRANARYLKLEPTQMMHLYDYVNKYRKEFIHHRDNKDIDRLFLSMGSSENLLGALAIILQKMKRKFPQMIDFTHIRTSVFTHWNEDEGVIEAMYKAGHRHISSTDRYRVSKYDELQKQLTTVHPMEQMNI